MYKFLCFISLVFFINASHAESTNVLLNGGFETGGTVGTIIYAGDVADGWYGSRASGAPAKKLHTDEPGGNRYVRFLADNAPSWSYIRHTSDTQTWKANHRYRFRMKLRIADELGGSQVIPEAAVLTISYLAIDNTGASTATIWKNFDLADFGPDWDEVGVALFDPDETFAGQLIRVQIQITGLDTPTMTHLDVDDVALEEIHDIAMVPITEHMMIATNMLVPNWFTSIAEGTERKDVAAAYYLDVPVDVTVDAAGGHELVNTIGKGAPVYAVNLETAYVVHNGENYKRYQLVPDYNLIHTLDDWIGPIYLSTTEAEGTQAQLYYHTSWIENSNVIESEEYSVSLAYRKFPEVGKPELIFKFVMDPYCRRISLARLFRHDG